MNIHRLLLTLAILSTPSTFTTQKILAYVCNQGSNSVSVIDTATDTVLTTAIGLPNGVPGGPKFIAITPDGTTAYVTCATDHSVKVIDTATNTLIVGSTIPITATDPQGIAITLDGNTAYVASSAPGSITPIDISNRLAPVPAISVAVPGAYQIAITTDGSTAYVTDNNDIPGKLFPLSLTPNPLAPTVGASIPITNGELSFLALTSNNATAFVATGSHQTFSTVNLNTQSQTSLISTITPQGIAVAPNQQHAYSAASISIPEFVSLDLSIPTMPSVVATFPITGAASLFALALTPDGNTAYITDQGLPHVYSIDITNPTAPALRNTITVGTAPQGLAIIFPPPPGPAAPTNVFGTVRRNIFLDKTEMILTIAWTASAVTSDPAVAYNIYSGSTLIGTVSASDALSFTTLVPTATSLTSFSVAAVDANGVESAHVPVTIA